MANHWSQHERDCTLAYVSLKVCCAGTRITQTELEQLWRRLQPLGTDKMPFDVPPRAAAGSASL